MESWDNNSERARKRLRLSNLSDCYIPQSTYKSGVNDRNTEWEGGYRYSIEGPEALFEANKAPLYSISDAHHLLNIDYSVTSSALPTQSIEDRPINFAACAESNITGHFQVYPSSERGGAKATFAQQVCFGMLDAIPIERLEWNDLDLDTQFIPICFGEEPETLQTPHGAVVGRINPYYSKLIRVLRGGHTVQAQAYLVVLPPQRGVRSRLKSKSKQQKQPAAEHASLSVILYGSMDIFEAVGNFLSGSSEFLQLPLHCDRDVPYRNPQSLTGRDENPITTFQLQDSCSSFATETIVQTADPSAALENEITFPETEAPAAVKTLLYSHQKQALSFMLMREQKSQMNSRQKGQWRTGFDDIKGTVSYKNTETGEICNFLPWEVRGGILADSMGLGKSLSIISLLATDWQQSANEASRTVPTLVVVPPSLLRTWEAQLRQHLHPGTLRYLLYHGPNRSDEITLILAYDVVITTYNVVATEWKSLEKRPRNLFSVTWRRIVLDEGKCFFSYTHEIRAGTSLRAKAVCALRACAYWTVTGTPIQNKWDDLASLLKFLGVYPEQDITSLKVRLRSKMAISDVRNMLATLCLRRSKQALNLPNRTDSIRRLSFDPEEAKYYKVVNDRVTGYLEQQVGQMNLRAYSTVLIKINSLRLICNLGKHYWRDRGPKMTQNILMQDMFDAMVSAGVAVCCECDRDVSVGDENNEPAIKSTDSLESSKTQITTCGELICAACFGLSEMVRCPSEGKCKHQSLCEVFTVDSSGSSDPSISDFDFELPVKMRALQEDLMALPETDKSIVFSFWTTTLDLAEIALKQVQIPYTRVDGTMPAKQRQQALETFVEDPRILTILISLRCGSTGLNLTAANHVFLMEPQWNPMVEDQALDRVHRIGQAKEVTTVRYIVNNTLEESIRHQQLKKRNLAEQAFALARGHNDWIKRVRTMLSNVPP